MTQEKDGLINAPGGPFFASPTPSKYMKWQAMKSLRRAGVHLLRRQPFYGVIFMGLELMAEVSVEGRPVETAATNGKILIVNPKWFMSLSEDHRCTVVMHEVMHVALLHHLRRYERDPELWNEAGDHAINIIIKDSGSPSLDDWLCDLKYRRWPTEHIYNDLVKLQEKFPDPPSEPSGDVSEPSSGGEAGGDGTQAADGENNKAGPLGKILDKPEPAKKKKAGEVWDATNDDGSPLTDEQRKKEERKLTSEVAMARATHKTLGSGSGSASLDEAVDSLISQSAGWEELLRDFWNNRGAGDPNETWRRFDRRAAAIGIWSPYKDKVGMRHVVLGFDKSGSVTTRERRAIFAQLQMLRDESPAERISIVPFNSSVSKKEVIELSEHEEIPDELPRGGGTRFAAVMNWVNELDEVPDVVIMLTDMQDYEYGKEPQCPVLWASTEYAYDEPDFGEVVVMDVP